MLGFPDWLKIDTAEIARGEPVGKPREKLTRAGEMLCCHRLNEVPIAAPAGVQASPPTLTVDFISVLPAPFAHGGCHIVRLAAPSWPQRRLTISG
ncbi:MAG: hypothetical protein ACREVE_07445 [Gammaproteobacteria bacterium]